MASILHPAHHPLNLSSSPPPQHTHPISRPHAYPQNHLPLIYATASAHLPPRRRVSVFEHKTLRIFSAFSPPVRFAPPRERVPLNSIWFIVNI